MNRDPTPAFPVPNDKKEKSKDTEGFASDIFLTKPYLRIKYITFNIICKDQFALVYLIWWINLVWYHSIFYPQHRDSIGGIKAQKPRQIFIYHLTVSRNSGQGSLYWMILYFTAANIIRCTSTYSLLFFTKNHGFSIHHRC